MSHMSKTINFQKLVIFEFLELFNPFMSIENFVITFFTAR